MACGGLPNCEDGRDPSIAPGGRRRWLTRSVVWRLAAATAVVIPLAVTLAVEGKSRHDESFGAGTPLTRRALLSSVRDLRLDRLVRQVSAAAGGAEGVDTETVNVTVVLEHLQLGPQEGPDTPWMFSVGDTPFVETRDAELAYFANTKFSWNAGGEGDATCAKNGSGEISRGYVDPYHNFLNLPKGPDFTHTTASLDKLELSDFTHINTARRGAPWKTAGQAGDSRRYKNGVFEILEDGQPLFRATDVQWIQNLSYPAPVGPSRPGIFEMSAYFVGKIDYLSSHNDWIARLDPSRLGYVLGIVTGGSFGAPTCYTSNSYWITLRGFPELSAEGYGAVGGGSDGGRGLSGAKTGPYPGSSDAAVAMAKALAAMARAAVTAVTVVAVGAAVTGATIAASGGQAPSPPGSGVARLLKSTAFSGKLSQIEGFHTDALKEFSSGLDPFLVRFTSPFARGDAAAALGRLASLNGTMRQATAPAAGPPPPSTITDDLFKGCAFYCSLIVCAFLILHLAIWLATRRKPIEQQVKSHAWMIYLFSITMSYIYTASVLSSIQYFRSNVPFGTGNLGIYFVAAGQLALIGVGFTVFFFVIMALALKRMRSQQVRWVPKELLADPELRRSNMIAGEYEADHQVWFHQLFESYYNAMAGPRVWLAAMELSIIFIDAALTALVWNEVLCLGLLMSIYAVMFCFYIALVPFVERVEGGMVSCLVLLELSCYIVEFVGALGDYATAERCETAGVVLGFMVIAFSVMIALLCDVIPTLKHLFKSAARRYRVRKHGFDPEEQEKAVERQRSAPSSDWSGLRSDTDDEAERDDVPGGEDDCPLDSDALVAYNAKREAETASTMSSLFARRAEGGGGEGGHRRAPSGHAGAL
jgi:hypothetical protein